MKEHRSGKKVSHIAVEAIIVAEIGLIQALTYTATEGATRY